MAHTGSRVFLVVMVVMCVAWTVPAFAGVTCDGTNDFITLANEANFDFRHATNPTTFTLTYWQLTSDATNITGTVSKGTATDGWDMALHAGVMYGNIHDTGTAEAVQVESLITVNNGAWHHIAGVYTTDVDTSANNMLVIYADAATSDIAPFRSGLGYASNAAAVHICRRGLQYTAMSVTNVQVWSAGLTAQQIEILSSSRLHNPPIPVVQALRLPLDTCTDGASTNTVVFPDMSGDGNNGTATEGTCSYGRQLIRGGVW